MRAIGLLGGTFDPIHVGHLRLAIEVRERARLDQVRLLPAPAPRLRAAPHADASVRLEMVRAAVEGIDGLVADGRELDVAGPTRTVDTLERLRTEDSRRPLCWILGADALERLDRWHEWTRLTELAHLIVVRRPGAALPTTGAVARHVEPRRDDDPGALARAPAGIVHVCDVPPLDVSATGIRERLSAGRSIDFLVPEKVKRMLLNEGHYIHG